MRVVIIEKTYKDSERSVGDFAEINAQFADNYPMECKEEDHDSLESAQSANPSATVMSTAQYTQFIAEMAASHADVLKQMKAKIQELTLTNQGTE